MKCGITEAQWTDYLDGAVPARQRREIESHLRECSTCRSEADYLRQMDQRLRIECGLLAQSLKFGLETAAQERILAALREAALVSKPPEVPERLWRVRWVLAMLCGPNTAGRIIECAGSTEEQTWLVFLRRLSFLTTEICGCYAGDLILAVGK
jgi:anti-sigma factor RsiW